jgi:hypothetical protein
MQNSTATWRCERYDRILSFLTLFSVNSNLHHHASKAKISICHRFFVRKICRTPVWTMFSFWKNPVEKCTRSFPRCNFNRGKVTLWRLLVSAPAAPSIIRFLIAGSSLNRIKMLSTTQSKVLFWWNWLKIQVGWTSTLLKYICIITVFWSWK